jgi:hypothetical protein
MNAGFSPSLVAQFITSRDAPILSASSLTLEVTESIMLLASFLRLGLPQIVVRLREELLQTLTTAPVTAHEICTNATAYFSSGLPQYTVAFLCLQIKLTRYH